MSNCMNKYRNEFAINFAKIMQEKLPQWKTVQKNERKSLYAFKTLRNYFFISLGAYIPGKHETNYDLKFHFFVSIGVFIALILLSIHPTNKNYQNRIKRTFYNDILKVFGRNVSYSCGDHCAHFNFDGQILTSLFDNSKLYSRKIMTRTDDDRFYGEYNGVKFKINETDFGWNEKDKYKTYHSMFKGVAMHFNMNKTIKSRVLIVSKGLWHRVPGNYEKVELEYNKFTSKYNVWVEKGGQVEARYLLNTVFIDRLMQIQTSFKVKKMACSVYEDSMLIMLSTNRDLFEMNHLFGRIDDIKQYKHLFDEFASVFSFIDILKLSSKTKL